MKIEILSVRDPVWADREMTSIDCFIRTQAYSVELPFTARADDIEPHGREIFQRCQEGEFGPVAPYVAPDNLAQDDNDASMRLPMWIQAWPDVSDFIKEANTENQRGTTRGIALVWGSMLETMFGNYLEVYLKSMGRGKNSLKDCKGNTVGTNFARAIDAAQHEGVIDLNLAAQLHAIRRIRNCCAHEWRLDSKNYKVVDLNHDFEILKDGFFPEFIPCDFDSRIEMVYSSACAQIIIYLAERSAQLNI